MYSTRVDMGGENSSYCCGQVAAFVSADPAQAADDVEHLELELCREKETYINRPFARKNAHRDPGRPGTLGVPPLSVSGKG